MLLCYLAIQMTEFWNRTGAAFVGCLLALVAVRVWDAYGWLALLGAGVLALGLFVFGGIKHRWDGNRGLAPAGWARSRHS